MEHNDRLEDLFSALREPATAAELANESAAVSSLAASLAPPPGASPIRTAATSGLSGRRLRVASFVAAGVIGFGGVAAAGPSIVDSVTGNDDAVLVVEEDPVETGESTVPATVASTISDTLPDEEDEQTDEPAVGETDALVTDESDVVAPATVPAAELVDDPATLFDETKCAEGSHGKTVSSVAKDTPSGPGKGEIVSTAAHSSCGKKDKADKHDESDESDQSDEADDEKSDKADKVDKKDKADKKDKSGKADENDEAETDESDETDEADDEQDEEKPKKADKADKPAKADKVDKADKKDKKNKDD